MASYKGITIPTAGRTDTQVAEMMANVDKYGSITAPAAKSPAPTPTPTPAASSFVSRPGYESDTYKASKDYYEGLSKTAPTTDDINVYKESQRQLLQPQIDLINQQYDQKIKDENQVGANREGATRALAARAGILTSDMGASNLDKTKQYNKSVIDAINSERSMKVSALLSKIDERTQAWQEQKTTEAKTNTEAYLSWLQTSQDSARNDMKEMAGAGASLSALKADSELYDELKRQTGYSDLEFDTLYNMNAANSIKYEYAWKGNDMVAYGVNPATGKMETHVYKAEDLGLPKGINPQFITDNAGNMFYYDQDHFLGADGKPDIKPLGINKGSSTNKSAEIQKITDVLTKSKDLGNAQAPYVDGNVYQTEKRKSTISPDEFDKRFGEMLSPSDRQKYQIGKATTEKNMTAANIDSQTLNDLVSDISQGATMSQLYSAYPEVSPSLIQSLYKNQ